MSDLGKDLTIKLKMDPSDALAEGKKFAQATKSANAEILADTKEVEKGKVDAAKKGSEEKLRNATKTKQELKNLEEQLLTEAEVREKAKVELVRISNRERVAAAVSASQREAEEHRRSGEGLRKRYEEVGAAGVKSFFDIAKSQAASLVGIGSLVAAVKTLGDAYQSAAEKQKALTKGALDKREQLAELADLKGVQSDNTFVTAFNARRKESGATHSEQLALETALMNSGASKVGEGAGKISQKEMDEVGVTAARIAVASKIDASVMGDLAGKAVGFKDYSKFGDKASEAVSSDLAASMAILKSGQGEAKQLAAETTKVAALNVDPSNPENGALRSLQDAAKLVSVMTEGMKEGQGEAANSVVSGLRDLEGKGKTLFSAAKITRTDDTFTALKKLAPVLEAEAKKQGGGRTSQDILNQALGAESLQAKAIGIAINRGVKGKAFDTLDKVEKENTGDAAVGKYLAASEGSERVLLRKATAGKEAAEDKAGASKSELEILRAQAEERLKTRGEIDTGRSNFMDTLGTISGLGFAGSGREQRIDTEVDALLNERAPKDLKKSRTDLFFRKDDTGYVGEATTARREDALKSKLDAIKSAGADPYGAVATPAMGAMPGAAGGVPDAGSAAAPGELPKTDDLLKKIHDKLPGPAATAPSPTPAPLPGPPRVTDR